MPTTTKMGIVYPASTDLVKDGATAMGTISTTVDAKTGMVLINTTSFSSVASISLAANTFNANYDNYRIIINHDSTGAAIGADMRMRAAGTDNTSANYTYANVLGSQAAAFVGGSNGTGALATSWGLVPISGTYSSTTIMDIFLPFSSSFQTNYVATTFYFDSLSNYRTGLSSGATSVTTSYDSLTYYVGGTMSGSYSVYGYNK